MKKHISELIVSGIALLYGLFLLFAGIEIFPFSIGRVAFLSTCVCLFAMSLAVATVQRNTIGLFFTFTFAVLIVSAVVMMFGYTSRNVYPLFIASVFCGGMGISPKLPAFRPFCLSLAMVGATLILMLESFNVLAVSVVLPILVIYFALLGITYALIALRKKSEEENL